MKIVCDSHIPFIREGLETLADEVVYMSGEEISHEALMDADVLVTRTRTHANQTLLEGTQVQLVVTATIGYDHLDTRYLDAAGIAWHNCPGCNATSVGQYVHSSLLAMQQSGMLCANPTVAIIGHGHVGRAVERALRPMVSQLLFVDPFLDEDDSPWDADVVTFHTPLTTGGYYPTLHMASTEFFSRLTNRPVIINSARGGVVDETALLQALDKGMVQAAVIDTWEGEPHISPQLLERAFIATPHIAGYSADGKANAARMTIEHIARHFDRECHVEVMPPELPDRDRLPADPVARALALYNPLRDSDALKAAPKDFESLRAHYPLRREQ